MGHTCYVQSMLNSHTSEASHKLHPRLLEVARMEADIRSGLAWPGMPRKVALEVDLTKVIRAPNVLRRRKLMQAQADRGAFISETSIAVPTELRIPVDDNFHIVYRGME